MCYFKMLGHVFWQFYKISDLKSQNGFYTVPKKSQRWSQVTRALFVELDGHFHLYPPILVIFDEFKFSDWFWSNNDDNQCSA